MLQNMPAIALRDSGVELNGTFSGFLNKTHGLVHGLVTPEE